MNLSAPSAYAAHCGMKDEAAMDVGAKFACPICHASTVRTFQKHSYWIRTCVRCQHQLAEITPSSQHVAQVYDRRYFFDGGAGYPNYLGEARLLEAAGRRYARLMQSYTKPGVLLDIGAAAGFILNGFQAEGWQGIGLEPNSEMVQYGQDVLHLDVRQGAIEDFEADAPVDLVTMIQVLPHFYNLRAALDVVAALTKPNGYWLIETWNRASWPARLSGQEWHEYSPPSVLHWFSLQGVRDLAQQFGFAEVAHGRPSKKLSGYHAKSLLRYKLKDLPLGGAVSLVLNVIPTELALPYPAFDLFWILLQKKETVKERQ